MTTANVSLNKDPREIILKPVVSEKSYGLIDEGMAWRLAGTFSAAWWTTTATSV